MPELPEVEVIRMGLEPLLVGRRIVSIVTHRKALRYPLPDFQCLYGHAFSAVKRRSKYLLFFMDESKGAALLVWHLGMTGQFHLLPQAAPVGSHEHVRLDLDDGSSLRYRDARRFGYADILDSAAFESHPWFASLGPEPLTPAFDCNHLQQICQGRKAAIKSVIMKPEYVVGVGNIYASEALFRAGIHPARAAGRISRARLQNLHAAIQSVLAEAIAAGGSTIRDFVKADGKPGYFAHAFQVYGRTARPCVHCGRAIRSLQLAGRNSFYCPGCQH